MARYRLSRRADADIAVMTEHSLERFGIDQTQRYFDGLKGVLQMLAERPTLGRDATGLAPDLRRWEYESHIVFYVPETDGILIVRVLHMRMDVERHSMGED